jgi:CheY-like chemotaxis protein
MPHDTPAPLSILVVDDSKISRNIACGLIRNRRPEARLIEAGDGAEAIAQARVHEPALVLMDVNMPGITGIEAAAQILGELPGTRIVLLTANVQAATQAKAQALGIELFRKPIKGEVIDQILQLLNSAQATQVNAELSADVSAEVAA